MSNTEAENKGYIDNRINPIFEKLLMDLVLKKPDSVCDFMIDWLKIQGKDIEKKILETKNDGKQRVRYI